MQPRRLALSIAAAGISAFALVTANACSSFSESAPRDADGGDPADAGAEAAPDAAAVPDGATTDAQGVDGPGADAGGRLIAFVTGVGYADVATTASADTKCQAEADGRLEGKFVAWMSSAGAPAPARLVDSKKVPVDGPWFRVDGRRIVKTRAALLATTTQPLETAINLSASGLLVQGGVWTGTRANGEIGTLCPGGVNPTSGTASEVDEAWTEQSFFTASCGDSLALYCFQVE